MPALAELTVDFVAKGADKVDKAIDKIHSKMRAVASMASKIAAAPSRALSALGTALDAAGQKMQKLGQAATKLSMMGSGFIGFFARAAIADTREGDHLAASFERLAKVVGQIFVPYVRLLTNGIMMLTKWFSGLSSQTKNVVAVIAILGTAFAAMVAVLPAIVAGLGALATVFATLMTPIIAIPALIVAIGAALLALLVDGDTWEEKMINIITAVLDAWDWLSEQFSKIKKIFQGDFDEMLKIAENAMNAIRDFLRPVTDAIREGFRAAFKAVGLDFDEFIAFWERGFKRLGERLADLYMQWTGMNEEIAAHDKKMDTAISLDELNEARARKGERALTQQEFDDKFKRGKRGIANNQSQSGSDNTDKTASGFGGGWGEPDQSGVKMADAIANGVASGIVKGEKDKSSDEKKTNRDRAKDMVQGFKDIFKMPKLDFSPAKKRMDIQFEGLSSTFDRIQKQAAANMGGPDKQDVQIQKMEAVHQDLQKIIVSGVKIQGASAVV